VNQRLVEELPSSMDDEGSLLERSVAASSLLLMQARVVEREDGRWHRLVATYVCPNIESFTGDAVSDPVEAVAEFVRRVHPDDRPGAAEAWAEATGHRPLRYSVEIRVRNLGEVYRWLQVSLNEQDEEPGLVFGHAMDVTERVEAHAAATAANQARSEFMARASHELRTPLNAIMGYGQLLALDELSEGQRVCVDEIELAGNYLVALIDEMLDMSRINSGEIELILEPVSVSEVITEVATLLQPLAAARGGAIRAGNRPASAHLLADHRRVTQILINLVSNAIKYSPGGAIAIDCTGMDVDDSADAGVSWKLAVTDTGPGIPDDLLGRLFEPFDRLGAETTTIQGSGMGLAIARGLATRMNGTLTVESRLGHGSTFTLTLPATTPLPVPGPPC
jgi:signal transduction histidine kinase